MQVAIIAILTPIGLLKICALTKASIPAEGIGSGHRSTKSPVSHWQCVILPHLISGSPQKFCACLRLTICTGKFLKST